MTAPKSVGRQPGELFDPEGVAWTRVSPRLARARRVSLGIWLGLLALAAVVPLLALGLLVPTAVVGMVFAALGCWGQWVIGRQVRAWGYAERQDDLLVRRGILMRKLVVVPYGRMQYVDVDAGPLDRMFRIATVQLHTAAAATDARIPGLPPEEAARLRDRLASRGEAQLAGL